MYIMTEINDNIKDVHKKLLSSDCNIVECLRKTRYIAKFFNDDDILIWIENELKGYTEKYLRDLPTYRKIKALIETRNGKKSFNLPYPLSIEDIIIRSMEKNGICKLIHYVDEPQLKGKFYLEINVSEFKNIINAVNLRLSDYIQEKFSSIEEIPLGTPLMSESNINFEEFAGYVLKLKDAYLFEDYSNLQVKIVAFNRNLTNKVSIYYPSWEILYFRLDFTTKKERYFKPKYSHPDQQLVLFKERINFKDLIEKMKREGDSLLYESGEFQFKFKFSIELPLNFQKFKDNIEPIYHIQQIVCKNQLSFVYFKLLKQKNFNFSEVLRIEFKVKDSTKLRNSTEVINEFIGYNLNSLCAPFIVIVYPIESFNIISNPLEEDGKKKIKIIWAVDSRYRSSFRSKVLVKGDYYEIPKEGFDIIINDDSPEYYSCIVQWNGKLNLTELNETLVKLSIPNPYYKAKPIRYIRGFKLNGIPKADSNQFFDKFLNTFLRIIDSIEGDHPLKNLIRTKSYKEEDFRDFFKTYFDVDENWNADVEFKGKQDRKNDLRVRSAAQSLFRISMEFKIWKRNFDKNEPVQELLDNMGNMDKTGLIFVINPNKSQINDKLKDELIIKHPKYISDTFKEVKMEARLFPIYKASYRYKSQSIEIYHIIFDLNAFFPENE